MPTRSSVPTLSRRRFVEGGLGAVVIGGAGCGGSTSSRPSGGGAERVVRHKYGSTRISGTPRRVLALGYTDLEPVLALGVRPLGIVEFFGDGLDASWPWETDRWGGQRPQIVGARDEFDFEKIAAARPDLILGMYSGMPRGDYEKLSRIAPTVAQPVGHPDYSAPWWVMTDLAGQALGRRERAAAAIRSVRARFARERRAFPGRAGQTVAVAEAAERTEVAVFGAGDPKLAFFAGLGYRVAPAVRRLEPGGDVATLSTERLDLLDVDRLVMLIDTGDRPRAELERDPSFKRLDVVRDGRTAFLSFSRPPVGAALSYNSVLSIPYAIEQVRTALRDR